MAAWRASGETLSGFAERHGFDSQRLGWWRRRLGTEPQLAPLIPVTVTNRQNDRGGDPAIRMRMDAFELEVLDPDRVQPAWLAAVLSLLAKAAR